MRTSPNVDVFLLVTVASVSLNADVKVTGRDVRGILGQ